MSAKTEDAELENVLQQMFMECDASVSTLSPDSTGDAVPLSRIIEYIQDQLPSWSIDDLVELWKCLVAVSTNDRVNLDQFKEATKCWIVKVQQSTQDSSNNAREKLYLVSDADSSMKMDMNKDIVEMELREKFRELYQENIGLHDELERHEESINNLKQQRSITENKLKHYIQKCQQLETENDQQKDQLNELIKKEKTMALALQRYTKEHQNLLKQLEAAEIEILTIPSLKEKLEKITKEKMNCMKLITKMEEEFQEKENNCNLLRTTLVQLEDTNTSIKESYEYKIRNLREENRVLKDQSVENMELSVLSWCSMPQETLSPISDTDECYAMHSTPYKSKNELMQDSLYTELKALGFTPECKRNDRKDLEEELNKYDSAICVILEQLEKVIQFFVTMRGSTDDLSHFNSQDTDARAHNISVLKHKATLLLYMVTEEITRRNTRRDSSTQLQADPTNATSNLDQFGVRNFRDLLLTHVFRSVHTLPSSMQSSSLTAEDLQWRTFGYPATNTADAPFARGDGLMHENGEEKSVSLVAETRDVSVQEDPARSEENRLCKTSKVTNVLQTDSKDEERTSARSFQVPEVSSASTPTNPRRKISVYCRSFDVVAVEDQREDHPRSNLEVRQSPSNPDDLPAQVDRIATRDQNSSSDTKYPFNHVYRSVKSESDSSNSSPRNFQDSLLDDELPVEQPILRKIRLAPTRLRFSQGTKNDLDKTAETFNCASPVSLNFINSTELDISDSPLSPIGEHKEDDDSSVHSSSTFTDKCKMEVKSVISESCLNKNVLQTNSMPNHRLFPCNQADSAILVNSEDPHSQASVRRVDSESQPRIERPVDSQMSSREDSLAVSGSELKPAAGSSDRCGIEKVTNGIGKTVNVSSTSLADPVSTRVTYKNVTQSDGRVPQRILSKTKQELLVNMRRSYSEGENLGRFECRCRLKNGSSIPESSQRRVFPSLTEIRLQESGIANLSDFEEGNRAIFIFRDNLSELELQKKYTAFSLCLSTDRLTLSRRIAISCRQRDQSERNLSCEVQKMLQDIQEAVKQRNSVSGRMTLRRPSFSSESPKWEMEKLDRTESSNSISELRGIFEQAESRRSSREENNNMLRPGHSNSQSTINCAIIDNEVWTNVKEETSPELSDNESINSDSKSSIRSSHTCQIRRRKTSCLSICMMSTLIFGVVFYAILAMSIVNTCHEPFNKRLIRCVFDKYRQIRNTVPHPM